MSGIVDLLLVEDSRADAQVTMRVLLKRRIADRIQWVQSGQEALDFLFHEGRFADREAGNPRLVILDINMPGLNGLQVLDRIRTHPLTRHVPIVLVTTSELPVDLRMGYDRGANSYLVKPHDHKEFADLVASIGHYWLQANRVMP